MSPNTISKVIRQVLLSSRFNPLKSPFPKIVGSYQFKAFQNLQKHWKGISPNPLAGIQSTRAYEAIADWKNLPGHDQLAFLTDKDIDSFIRNNSSVLIMFYAPWCYHCKNAKPEYARAADILAKEFPSGRLAAIDCILYPSIYEKYEIVGYPTLIYYWNGKKIGEYHHRRRASDFVHFMLREPKTKADL